MYEGGAPDKSFFADIENRVEEIMGVDMDSPVFLHGASYLYNDKNRSRVTVNCIFRNGDGELCADLHVELSGGHSEFHTGKSIEKIGKLGLRRILQALKDNRWSKCEI